jgi:hypothetical protein
MLKQEVRKLIEEARVAVGEIIIRSHLVQAWNHLQEHDAEGNPRGTTPYTDKAITAFQAAYSRAPEDIIVTHHLAIAHHARAWDLELRDDPRAEAEWEQALSFWQALADSSAFWTGLETKLLNCDPQADPGLLVVVQREFFDNLLDIHVDFIRHHLEIGDQQRAMTHVGIIGRSRMAEPIKNRFTEKVFQSLTGAVQEAKMKQDYESALTALERFLSLFPDHLLALRMYAEVCKEWASGLSYQDSWDEIEALGSRAYPRAKCLRSHPDLTSDPLAMTAMEEAAFELGVRGRLRGEMYLAARETRATTVAEHDAASSAFRFSIEWGQIAKDHSPDQSPLKNMLSTALFYQAVLLHLEAQDLLAVDSEVIVGDLKIVDEAILRLYSDALALAEESLIYVPGDEAVLDAIKYFKDKIAEYESRRRFL